MPYCVSNDDLDEMIEHTSAPEEVDPEAVLMVFKEQREKIHAALRDLRRIRRELRTGKLKHTGKKKGA